MKATTKSPQPNATGPASFCRRAAFTACGAFLAVAPACGAHAQETAAAPGDEPDTAAIRTLISIVAEKADYEFLVDPRVRADVTLIGQDPADVEYGDLLTILRVYRYAAVRDGNYVSIVPDASVRSMAVPVAAGRENRDGQEIVTKVITARNVPAAFLVPVMRPLIPQWGHLSAFGCSNTLIVVDTVANVERLEELLESVDVGEPFEPPSCETQPPRAGAAPPGGGPRRPAAEPTAGEAAR